MERIKLGSKDFCIERRPEYFRYFLRAEGNGIDGDCVCGGGNESLIVVCQGVWRCLRNLPTKNIPNLSF